MIEVISLAAIIAFVASGLTLGEVPLPSGPTASQTKVIVVAPDGSKKEGVDAVKAKELVGEYYCGDGYGYNLDLILKEGGRFKCTWSGCLGVYGRSSGGWSVDREGVKLAPESADGTLKDRPLARLRVVRFREHYLLLQDKNRGWFDDVSRNSQGAPECPSTLS
jgi:hypothetical protein